MTDLLIHRADSTGKLSYSLSNNPEKVSGVSQLVQEIVIELLSDYDPVTNRGSNLSKNLANLGSISDVDGARSAVDEAVRATRTHILTRQQNQSSLRADERLRDLTLLSVTAGDGFTWKIELNLTTLRGQSIVFTVPGFNT